MPLTQPSLLPVRDASRACAFTLALGLWAGASAAWAQPVKVEKAWVRATTEGQRATGGFMTLTAPTALRLVAVASPVAGVAEVHEMKMDGEVMRMRPVADGVPLPAGVAVELKPGGFHVMLMDLKAGLPKDSTVPVTLTFKDAAGKTSQQTLQVPVQLPLPNAAATSMR
jgi:periplasmic copper chaperone A